MHPSSFVRSWGLAFALVMLAVFMLSGRTAAQTGSVPTPTPTLSREQQLAAVPTPPATPLCVERVPLASDIVRAGGSDRYNNAIFCRTLMQNGQYIFYRTNPLTSAANLGDLGDLAPRVRQAVDVFSPDHTYWEGGFVMCLRGTGTMVYMRASGAPRVAEIVETYRVADFPGFTCVTLFEPGTLLLASR